MANPSTLKQTVYNFIRERIILGEMRPGARITEEAVAEETGVSRGPIREAIRQLDSEGIVRHVAHQGATVYAPTAREFEELLDLRVSLESGMAARAAERATPRQIEQLREEVDRLRGLFREIMRRRLKSMDETLACGVTRADLQFHSTLIDAADSPRAAKMLRDTRVLSLVWSQRQSNAEGVAAKHVKITLHEHGRIVDAVANRDAGAARAAMVAHLEHSKAVFLPVFDATGARVSDKSLAAFPAVRRLLAGFEREALFPGTLHA